MRQRHEADEGVGAALLALYDQALPEVYEYIARRCGSRATADDLTAETFLAAVDACARQVIDDVSIAWLIGIARHKLVDHWRRLAREERVADDAHMPDRPTWDAVLDPGRVSATLGQLNPMQRAALVLRHVDGLPVAAVAEELGRTVHATETLLVRARAAFRQRYERESDHA